METTAKTSPPSNQDIMPIRARIVPYHLVAEDAEQVKHKQDTSNPSARSQRFNTAHHHLDEILPVIPSHPHFSHSTPPWTPFGYALWHPLITKSQAIQPSGSFIGRIPSFLWQDIMRIHASWVSSNRIPQHLLTDMIETWESTKSGKEIAQYFDGQRKWFIRLDQMSPKDSPLGGKLPSSTLREVTTKICSSMRAYRCLLYESEEAREQGRDMRIKIVVNRWDDGMDAAREFRVFVPPPQARLPGRTLDSIRKEDVKISAISQYRWPFPFALPYPDTSLDETAQLVYAGAKEVLGQILDFADAEIDNDIRDMLIRWGFSFDIIVKEGRGIQLVEINPFGALSGCGACLFNWVVDGKVLYGLEEDVEFAVTLEDGYQK